MARRRKPLELHKAEGTFRKDRHAPVAPMGAALTDVPEPPAHLSDLARQEWTTLAAELVGVSLLTRRDLNVLADYCSVRATILECEAVIAKEGRTIETPQGRKRHPELVTLEKARAELRLLGSLLGLSPADRAKLRLPEKPPSDDTSDFLFKKYMS